MGAQALADLVNSYILKIKTIMSHFNVLSNAFLQSKYNSMWQNRIEYEAKSQLMWQNECESEDVTMEESENQENIEKECWISNTNNKSIEGEAQNNTSLYHQMQQRMKKKSQIKRVTWNKNLIDVKFISPRITRKRPQFMPVNNSIKLMQKCSNSSQCVQSSSITNQDVQIPQAIAISRKDPSISFKEKCQKFKLKNKDSGLVLALNSNLYS